MGCCLEWCGQCYENARGRAMHTGHRFRLAGVERGVSVMSLVRRGGSGSSSPGEGPLAYDADCLMGKDTFDFLTATEWPGSPGDKRQPGTIMFFLHDGRLKVVLNDRDWGKSAFAALDPACSIWGAVEAILGDPGTDWRVNQTHGAKKR